MTDQPPTKRRWPIWKILLLAAVAFLLYVIASAFNVYRKIPESYAAWASGNLIVDYLNTHSNRWPRSWEELEQATNCLRYVPIDTLRTKLKIDWEVNFDDLVQMARTNPSTSLHLVTRLDGSKLQAIWGTTPSQTPKSCATCFGI